MTILLFANNAQTTLASGISASATTCTLATGTGIKFPSPSAGQAFKMTFTDAASGTLNEIVLCTARTSDVCTIVRAQEGTTARSWIAGDIASNYFTAGAAASFAQISTNTPTVTTVTSAFYTQTTSDTTLIINTAFDVVLTLLNPASYYGNFLWIKNPNGVNISSASSNVVPSGSLSAGTSILENVVGTSCLLQSDGTNWNVISTSFQPSGF
jgi:hypothetical protein